MMGFLADMMNVREAWPFRRNACVSRQDLRNGRVDLSA